MCNMTSHSLRMSLDVTITKTGKILESYRSVIKFFKLDVRVTSLLSFHITTDISTPFAQQQTHENFLFIIYFILYRKETCRQEFDSFLQYLGSKSPFLPSIQLMDLKHNNHQNKFSKTDCQVYFCIIAHFHLLLTTHIL